MSATKTYQLSTIEKFQEDFEFAVEGIGKQVCASAFTLLSASSSGSATLTGDQISAAIAQAIANLDFETKVKLIQLHPQLVVSRLKHALTAQSENEHKLSGLSQVTDEDVAKFEQYNKEYVAKFAIPFVVCVRLQQGKQGILSTWEQRMSNSREEEIATAIEEIKKIGRLRIMDKYPVEGTSKL